MKRKGKKKISAPLNLSQEDAEKEEPLLVYTTRHIERSIILDSIQLNNYVRPLNENCCIELSDHQTKVHKHPQAYPQNS